MVAAILVGEAAEAIATSDLGELEGRIQLAHLGPPPKRWGRHENRAGDFAEVRLVLVVEDDPAVRAIAMEALREHGFRVVGAANGLVARELLATSASTVDLVVTDMVMPELGGRELAEWIGGARPDLPILFTSAYAEQTDIPVERWAFLQKPYVPAMLIEGVRELLGGTT